MKYSRCTLCQRLFLILSILAMACPQTKADVLHGDTIVMSFNFRLGSDALLRDYRGNDESFLQLHKALSEKNNYLIDKIIITGSSSPEGPVDFNKELSLNRAYSLRTYIFWKLPHVNRSLIQVAANADMLYSWQKAIEKNSNVPNKDKVIEILYSDNSIPNKWANIQQLENGATAAYMTKNIFPKLRNAVSCVVTLRAKDSLATIPTKVFNDIPNVITPKVDVLLRTPINNTSDEVIEIFGRPKEYSYKPLFAVKTNLLFDLASLLNVEIEVPIGKRFSIAGEWVFPWWLWEKKQHALEMLNGNIEGRYWFGKRDDKEVMTGWFAGLYAGGGYYDLEWNKTGYQGEFLISAGVSGGFVHKIGKNLRMEYSLGIGYMQTNYRKYEAKFGADNEWHLYKRDDGKFTWIGPTKLKVSLVWMLNSRKEKGGLGR